MNLNDFKVNKNLSAIKQVKLVKKYIDRNVNKTVSAKQIKFISDIFKIPKSVIRFEFKKYLSANYNFKHGKFNKKMQFKKVITSLIYYYANLIIFLILSKQIKFKKKIKIIFDEIFSQNELERSEIFLKNANSYKIISKIKNKKNLNIVNYPNFYGCSQNYLFKNFLNFFIKIPYFVLKSSFNDKMNYFPFYIVVMKINVRYETLFKQYRARILLQERPYSTSAIKNYLFKKYGGHKTCCFQRILFNLAHTSFYINADVLFSLGKMSAKTIALTGSKVSKIVPLGSFSYYSKWIKSKKIKTKKYDIVYLNVNTVPAYAISNKYLKNYYMQLNWLRLISLENPHLKILLKHHRNNTYHDPEELKIIKGTNIERISSDTFADRFNNSYGYAINSKIRLSWASTMIYELLGHNYQSFFLDPKHENSEFLQNHSFNKKYRIKNYKDFKKKINDIIFKRRKANVINPDHYCLNSKAFFKRFKNFLDKF